MKKILLILTVLATASCLWCFLLCLKIVPFRIGEFPPFQSDPGWSGFVSRFKVFCLRSTFTFELSWREWTYHQGMACCVQTYSFLYFFLKRLLTTSMLSGFHLRAVMFLWLHYAWCASYLAAQAVYSPGSRDGLRNEINGQITRGNNVHASNVTDNQWKINFHYCLEPMTYSSIVLCSEFLYISCISFGFFLSSCTPIYFELTVEGVYPVAEGVTTMALTLLNNTAALLFLLPPLIPGLGE